MAYKRLSELYNPNSVDPALQADLLAILSDYRTAEALGDIGPVFLALVLREEPPTPLVDSSTQASLDRGRLYWFYDGLCTPTLYGAAQPRLPDGQRRGPSAPELLARLADSDDETAIHTWIAVCIAWLQVCNVDWYIRDHQEQRRPAYELWSPGQEQAIPGYLAGSYAQVYF